VERLFQPEKGFAAAAPHLLELKEGYTMFRNYRKLFFFAGIFMLAVFLGVPSQARGGERLFRGTFIGAADYGSFLIDSSEGAIRGTLFSAKYDGSTTEVHGQITPDGIYLFEDSQKIYLFEGTLDEAGRLMGNWSFRDQRGGSFTGLETTYAGGEPQGALSLPGPAPFSQALRGTYTGEPDYGTFRIVVGQKGSISGMIVSAKEDNPLPLEVRGEAQGSLGSFETLDGTRHFYGTFDEIGRFIGKWQFQDGSHGGSFTGLVQKQ
jgi:hypothetical protein